MKLTEETFSKYYEAYLTMRKEVDQVCDSLGVFEWIGDSWLDNFLGLFLDMCEFPRDDDEFYSTFFDMLDDNASAEEMWNYIWEVGYDK